MVFVVFDCLGVYVDGIFGCGGYMCGIFVVFFVEGCLYVFDMDLEVIKVGKEFEREDFRFKIYYVLFGCMVDVLRLFGVKLFGVFLDLGIFLF